MRKKDYCFMWRRALPVLLLSAVTFVWGGSRLSATPRSEGEARLIAENFLKTQTVTMKRSTGASEGLVLAATSADLSPSVKRTVVGDSPAWYAFNQGTEAFVIVSGDDRMSDILGYSTEGGFVTEGMPGNIRNWLDGYTALAEAVAARGTVAATAVSPADAGYPESVLPLLGDIHYNQDAPYNLLCPWLDETTQCVTGCSATAAVTIMSYWKYPERGTGSHSYTTMSYGLPCSFDYDNTPFDWDNILPTYVEGEYTEEQAEAIATLMYACGVSMDMDYGPESGTVFSLTLEGMIKYLGYNPYAVLCDRGSYTTQEWMELVYGELSSSYPVLYTGQDRDGGSHAFVLDGYDRNGLVHVDWGWGGRSNGYFNIALLNPYELGIGSGNGGGYTFAQWMYTGLVPSIVNSVPTSCFGLMSGFCIKDDTMAIEVFGNLGYGDAGSLAAIAERDGVQTPISQLLPFENIPLFNSCENVQLPLLFPTEAGDYRIYFASRVEGEAQWTKVRCTGIGIDEYRLTVHEDGTHDLVTGGSRLLLPELKQVTCDKILYAGCYGNFEVSIANPSDDEYLSGYVSLYEDGVISSDAFFQNIPVLLSPGQDTTLIVPVMVPDKVGIQQLAVYWQPNVNAQLVSLDYSFTAEVQKGIVTNTVNLRDAWLDRDVYEQGDTITCTWQMDIEGQDADIFSQMMVVGIWPEEFGGQLMVAQPIVTVEQGKVSEFSQQMVVNLEPGRYRFLITCAGYMLWCEYFTVTASSTSIADVQADADAKPEWCPAPGSTDLCFRYAKEVNRVVLYDMTGRLVRTADPVRGADGIYTVSGSGLQHAPYILRIHAADGSTATLKLVR